MNQADRIRSFVMDAYVRPARNKNVVEIEVRAGDIHRQMELSNAMPAVCSALGSNKFEHYANVKTIARTGPSNGSNARFRYRVIIEPLVPTEPLPPLTSFARPRVASSPMRPITASTSVTLVSCVKSKLPHKATARELYTSTQFRGARRFAEATGGPWYVLSALYGLVAPDTVIAPYDYTLNTLPVAGRREWAEKTFNQLMLAEPNLANVVVLAGQRYREFLVPMLVARGIEVKVPMAHLRQGEQLAWLAHGHDASV